MRLILLLLCCATMPAVAAPGPCSVAIAAAERSLRTAPGLLDAIGLVESGRTDPRSGMRQAWPWTVTAQGVGSFYPAKADAIAAVEALRAKGVSSIDVGCMQVNLLHHPGAFRDLDQAFDPVANAAYAGRFLSGLYARLGTWPAAAAGYHSLTPERGAQYGRLIAAVWAGAPVPTSPGPGGMQVVTFPDGGQMRLLRDFVSGQGRVLGYLSGPR